MFIYDIIMRESQTLLRLPISVSFDGLAALIGLQDCSNSSLIIIQGPVLGLQLHSQCSSCHLGNHDSHRVMITFSLRVTD